MSQTIPSHHHKFIGGMFAKLPVMGGKNGNGSVPTVEIFLWDDPPGIQGDELSRPPILWTCPGG